MEKTDYELVTESLNGSGEAYAEIVTRYKRLVFSIAGKFVNDSEEINDISQDVFMRVYRVLGKYDPQYRFSTWLAKVATNVCLDHLRKNKKSCVSFDEIEEFFVDDGATPEDACVRNERIAAVRREINKLPEIYRTPIVLYHQKGMSYKEIAEKLGKPMSIVKNRIFRARLTLKESLAGV
jgi:RNA polymerase sigma-70 factor (ECF subfamily)